MGRGGRKHHIPAPSEKKNAGSSVAEMSLKTAKNIYFHSHPFGFGRRDVHMRPTNPARAIKTIAMW